MTPGARELSPTEIEDLAAGAWILGAGGGGNPYHSLLNLRAEAARGFRPVVIPAESLADDDLVAVVSTMGAPLVGEERLPDPDVAARPVQVLAERLGKPFAAVMSLEIGGNLVGLPMVSVKGGSPVFRPAPLAGGQRNRLPPQARMREPDSERRPPAGIDRREAVETARR